MPTLLSTGTHRLVSGGGTTARIQVYLKIITNIIKCSVSVLSLPFPSHPLVAEEQTSVSIQTATSSADWLYNLQLEIVLHNYRYFQAAPGSRT